MVTEALTPNSGGRALSVLPAQFSEPHRPAPAARAAQALLEKAIAAGLLLIEDDPYGELYYKGEQLPILLSMNPEASSTWARSPRCWRRAARRLCDRAAGIASQAGTGQAGRRPAHARVHAAHRSPRHQGRLPRGAPAEIRTLYAAQCEPCWTHCNAISRRAVEPPAGRHVHLGHAARSIDSTELLPSRSSSTSRSSPARRSMPTSRKPTRCGCHS